MLSITYEEAEARAWLDDLYAKEKAEKKEKNDKSRNAEYDFY